MVFVILAAYQNFPLNMVYIRWILSLPGGSPPQGSYIARATEALICIFDNLAILFLFITVEK
jgi:hypothetical protein